MPKVYSQSEKDDIKGRLKEATRQSLSMNGIKKTTVDSLVKEVNIPKGTFYLFYKSTFFRCIIACHKSCRTFHCNRMIIRH